MRASFGVGSVCVTLATDAGLSAGFSRAEVDGNIFDNRTLARIPTWFSYLAMATLGIQESDYCNSFVIITDQIMEMEKFSH